MANPATGRWRSMRPSKCIVWMPSVVAVLALVVPGSIAAKLPPGTLHGNAYELDMYPTVSLATAKEKTAARDLLNRLRAVSARWQDISGAAADGYSTRTRPRRPGDHSVHYFHAGRPPGPPSFDVNKPKAIIYGNAPGRPLVLVGVMFAMPRGEARPDTRGPDHPVAHPHGVHRRRRARHAAAEGRIVSSRVSETTGQRDDAHVVDR